MQNLNNSEIEALRNLLLSQILDLGNKIIECNKMLKVGLWNERTLAEKGAFEVQLYQFNQILNKLKK